MSADYVARVKDLVAKRDLNDEAQLEQLLSCIRSMMDNEIDKIATIVGDGLLQSALNDAENATVDYLVASILTLLAERSLPSVNCNLTFLRNILHRPSMVDCQQVQVLVDAIEQHSEATALLTALQGIYNEAKFTVSVDSHNSAR